MSARSSSTVIPTVPQDPPNHTCKFYDGSLKIGDPVIVYGADGTILGKGNLEDESTEVSNVVYCALRVTIDGIKAGESAYKVEIGDFDPVIASEAEMRRDPALFRPRDAIGRLSGDPVIEVESEPYK